MSQDNNQGERSINFVTVEEKDQDRIWDFLQEHYLRDEPMLRSCKVMEGSCLSDRYVRVWQNMKLNFYFRSLTFIINVSYNVMSYDHT